MSTRLKRAVLLAAVLAVIAIVTTAVLTLTNGTQAATPTGPRATTPTQAAHQYLQALAQNDLIQASLLTDNPDQAAALLTETWQNLHPTQLHTTLQSIDRTSATYTATWSIAGHTWTYQGTFTTVRANKNWRVHWTPAVLYPKLRPGQRLVAITKATTHPAVVDRTGKPLVTADANGVHLATKNFGLIRSTLIAQVPATASTTFAVERVDAAGRNLETLAGDATGQTKPVRSTLSVAIQSAAQSAVDGYDGDAVIVVLRPSDGGILAVARNARSDVDPFSGLYAPGSTFKIVTATAALEHGVVDEDSRLPCPSVARIGPRKIHNDNDFDLGTVTMRRAFAESCNTTFSRLAFQLPGDGLVDAARQFGLNADFDIPGLDTQTGRVVPAASVDEQVEDGIGQGRVLVSPFGEALMAATVAAGHAVTPRLWQDDATAVTTGYTAPPGGVLAPLRRMMRAVVTEGTATGLDHSGLVYGKTGTAQFGDAVDANGWFAGYRGDVAFVVFLAGSGNSTPAVALGAKFLAGLG